MRVALFFGTFDPLHIGHVAIMGHVLNSGQVDELWLVPSPHNPLKNYSEITPYEERVAALRASLAYYASPRLRLSEIEKEMPRPSYTILTLERLCALYPEHTFSLLIGGDSLATLPHWYRGEEILANYQLLVYPRGEVRGLPPGGMPRENIHFLDAPRLDISSTYIRAGRRAGQDMRFFEAGRLEGVGGAEIG